MKKDNLQQVLQFLAFPSLPVTPPNAFTGKLTLKSKYLFKFKRGDTILPWPWSCLITWICPSHRNDHLKDLFLPLRNGGGMAKRKQVCWKCICAHSGIVWHHPASCQLLGNEPTPAWVQGQRTGRWEATNHLPGGLFLPQLASCPLSCHYLVVVSDSDQCVSALWNSHTAWSQQSQATGDFQRADTCHALYSTKVPELGKMVVLSAL